MVNETRRALPVSTPFDLPFSAKVFSLGTGFTSRTFSVSIPDNLYVDLICFSTLFDTAAGVRSTDEGSVNFYRGGLRFLSVPAVKLANNQVGSITWAQFGYVYQSITSVLNRQQNLPAHLHLYPADLIIFDLPSFTAGDIFSPMIFHGHTWEVY